MAYPKKKTNFKRKTNDRKANDRETRFKEERNDKANDPQWYVREGQLAKDVASISFNTALGVTTPLDMDNGGGDYADSVPLKFSAPGVMAINYVPSVGISRNGYSPINIAAKNLYSWVRHQNSGSKNYDSPDLILYVMAMDSVFAAIQHLQRAYGTARVYSQVNRYVGDAYLTAMGFEPADVRANLAQFRAQINMLIVKASVFAIPNTFSMFKRHAWMNRVIFQDSDLEKCQVYMYRPMGLFKYIETNGAGHCDLTLCASQVNAPSSGMEYVGSLKWTTAQWFAYVDDMLTALTSSEDIGIMSGDILKAYGRENLFSLALVPEDYSLEVTYSEEVLDQIHNTIFSGAQLRTILDPTNQDQLKKVNLGSWSISQDTSIGDGALLYGPQVIRKRDLSIKHILDINEKDPSPERVLVSTRNMICGTSNAITIGSSPYTYETIEACASDICVDAIMYRFVPTEGGGILLQADRMFTTDGTEAETLLGLVGAYTAFTKAPIVYLYSSPRAGADAHQNAIIGQIDNYTIIDRSTLSKMHESAILSMLGVPV